MEVNDVVVQNKKYETADDFILDCLIPSGEMFQKTHDWIARGEDSEKYKLLPNAFRMDNRKEILKSCGQVDENKEDSLLYQLQAEMTLLKQFYVLANNSGLKVPNIPAIDDLYMTDIPKELISQYARGGEWVSDEYKELAALAQHHGVKTRLLDWSNDIFVALYFATTNACNKLISDDKDDKDNIVIWLLNMRIIEGVNLSTKKTHLQFVVPSYNNNPNLNAQKGILSYWRENYLGNNYLNTILEKHNMTYKDYSSYIENGDLHKTEEVHRDSLFIKALLNSIMVMKVNRTPLDELLTSNTIGINETLLYKITIPIVESPKLWQYVTRIGYTASRLFPGYNGVFKEMEQNEKFKPLLPKGTNEPKYLTFKTDEDLIK